MSQAGGAGGADCRRRAAQAAQIVAGGRRSGGGALGRFPQRDTGCKASAKASEPRHLRHARARSTAALLCL